MDRNGFAEQSRRCFRPLRANERLSPLAATNATTSAMLLEQTGNVVRYYQIGYTCPSASLPLAHDHAHAHAGQPGPFRLHCSTGRPKHSSSRDRRPFRCATHCFNVQRLSLVGSSMWSGSCLASSRSRCWRLEYGSSEFAEISLPPQVQCPKHECMLPLRTATTRSRQLFAFVGLLALAACARVRLPMRASTLQITGGGLPHG